MKTARQYFSLGVALAFGGLAPTFASESPVVFGLPHTPLGGALLRVESGNLVVTPAGEDEEGGAPFGVAVDLGEADTGVFGALDTYNSLNGEGMYMVGQVFGQVEGLPEQEIGSLRVDTVGWYSYLVSADFSPLGSSRVHIEVYEGSRLVATASNVVGGVAFSTFNSGPRANPFSRGADGSIGAVVDMGGAQYLSLTGDMEDEEGTPFEVWGDRFIIRPANPSVAVDFASRVELTAGGGEDLIVVTQERLGVFHRGHQALGPALMNALAGELTVSSLPSAEPSEEIGLSIGLDSLRQFSLRLAPVDLASHGASISASAIGAVRSSGGEFLGLAGLRNAQGALEAFGNFDAASQGVQIAILRAEALVGTVPGGAGQPAVPMSGHPRLIGFEAFAGSARTPSGYALRLDQVTTFTLPDGSTLEGDQIAFRTTVLPGVEGLASFSLNWSGLAPVTITQETDARTVSISEYFTDVVAPTYLKRFDTADEGILLRSPSTLGGPESGAVTVTDRLFQGPAGSNTYVFQPDGLYYLGGNQGTLVLSSERGLRWLPEVVSVGQTYLGGGSFTQHDPATGLEELIRLECWTTVAALAPAGQFNSVVEGLPVLRLETVSEFTGSSSAALPLRRWSTNWLAPGLGVVGSDECDLLADGSTRRRSARLSAYFILNTPARALTANVGAGIVVRADVTSSWDGNVMRWLKDGVLLEATQPSYGFSPVRPADAGVYSVQLQLPWGNQTATTVGEVARLTVIPFSDTPPFWVTNWGITGSHIAMRTSVADAAGNVYVAGDFYGNLVIAGSSIASKGRSDAFLAKVSPAGQILWVRTAGGSALDYSAALGLDAAGQVYLAGTFGETARFGSLSLSSVNGRDALFVTKLDADGNFLWASASAGDATAGCSSLVVDPNGGLVVSGLFNGGTAFFGATNLSNPRWGNDLYLTKLDAQGRFLWAKQGTGGGTIYPEGTSLAVGALTQAGPDGFYLTGSYQDEFRMDAVHFTGVAWGYNGFVLKTDLQGAILWAKPIPGSVQTSVSDPAGQLYLHGTFSGTPSWDGLRLCGRVPGYNDVYLAKLGPDGQPLWARVAPCPSTYARSPLALDSAGNLYISDSFAGEILVNGTSFFTDDAYNTMLSKLDPDGRDLWHKQLGGNGHDYSSVLAADQAGNVFLSGGFHTWLVLGEKEINSPQYYSAYVVKITGATAPSITRQPQSLAVNLGQPFALTVEAAGTEPFAFQWSRNGQPLPGATLATYTVAAAQPRDAGLYSVLVRNAGGRVTSTTATVQLTTSPAGVFAFDRAAYAWVATNAQFVAAVLRTGDTSSVAWVEFFTADGTAQAGADYTATAAALRFAPGETLKTVVVPVGGSTGEGAGTVLLRLANPSLGAVLGSPAAATLALTDGGSLGAPVIRTQPISRSIPVGATVTLTVVAKGAAPLSYQWLKDAVALPGATNRLLTFANVQLADAGAYSVTVRNPVGETLSATAALTVLPVPVIVTQPAPIVVPYGDPVTFTVQALSSFPLATQVFTRVSSGSAMDTFLIPGGLGGTLRISYDFGTLPDTMEVYLSSSHDEAPPSLRFTTNGAGALTLPYATARDGEIEFRVWPDQESDDGWSYRIEKECSPLTYRWLRNGYPLSYAATPTFTLPFANFWDAGAYTVIVTDPAGSVLSQAATLQVIGPRLVITAASPGPNGEARVQLTWTVSDFHLEMTEDLATDPWHDVPEATSGIILTVGESQTLFRLARTVRPD